MNTHISNNRNKIIQTFLLLIILVGCKRVEPPENIKVNPNQSEKYLVTIQFDDVAEIRDVKTIKNYLVSNERTCSPIDPGRSIGGSWNEIRKDISSKLPPIAHNKFQIIYYPQMFLDEAYYSMEVCHWKGYGIQYSFYRNNVWYEFRLNESEITDGNKVSIQCESLKKNTTEGTSQRCKSHELSELAMIDSYFVIAINSREISK